MRQPNVTANRIRLGKFGKEVNANTTAEAIKEAGLDWQVKAVPLFTGAEYGGKQVQNRAIIREHDNHVLGVVGKSYHPLQNGEAFNFFDPFLESGEARIERAWSLGGGSDICILAELNRKPMEIAKDDPVRKFLLLSNSHRGGISVRVTFSPIRVHCTNQLAMIYRKSEQKHFMKINHHAQVVMALDEVRNAMNIADGQFEEVAESYKLLAKRQVKPEIIKPYVKQLFHTTDETQRQQAREDKMVETIERLFETGKGNELPAVRGTYWALYNGVTEYLTHEAGKDEERRMRNLWFGGNFNLNKRALDLALEMAGVQ